MTATNTFGANGLVSRNTPATGTVFYAFDERGNVAHRMSSTGAVLSSDLYDAYGKQLAGASDVYGFEAQAGYRTDPETGLLLLTHRYYDPATGRFVTRDPIGYEGGINLYGYTQNDPVNESDANGTLFGVDDAAEAYAAYLLWLAAIAAAEAAAQWAHDHPIGPIYWNPPWSNTPPVIAVPPSPAPPMENRRGSKGVATLRREWEKLNNQPWPTDAKGRRHIAEHKVPLADGGADDGTNIEPLSKEDHTQQHKDRGDFQRWGKRSGKGKSCPSP